MFWNQLHIELLLRGWGVQLEHWTSTRVEQRYSGSAIGFGAVNNRKNYTRTRRRHYRFQWQNMEKSWNWQAHDTMVLVGTTFSPLEIYKASSGAGDTSASYMFAPLTPAVCEQHAREAISPTKRRTHASFGVACVKRQHAQWRFTHSDTRARARRVWCRRRENDNLISRSHFSSNAIPSWYIMVNKTARLTRVS